MTASRPSGELQQLATAWRARLKSELAALQAHFEAHADVARLLRRHAGIVDTMLKELWVNSGLSDSSSLIAVGGYGRGELFPYSDVDLLILLPNDADQDLNQRIEAIIGVFWDIGLAVGHSVRTLDECIMEAENDITVQTNMQESRLLIGNPPLYKCFQTDTAKVMHIPSFFAAKMREQEQRHARFNDTAYNLEPNIKESPGGLRDLQTILWVARSAGLGESWAALVKHELISTSELRQIRRHEKYLQMLRMRLHYLAHRREDRLIFDFQNELAKQLGYVSSGRKRASEQLMHGYYRSAKFVSLINEILLQLLNERLHPAHENAHSINQYFEARKQLLDIKSATLLQRHPSAILQIFLLLQQHPELTGMSARLLRTLHRVKKLVNREFRQDPVNKAVFLQILQQPQGVTEALKRMNRYGILGNYLPAFGRIVGQMQHDLFHVYTVDEHILNVLHNLQRFSLPDYAHEFPLCSKLFEQFDSPYLLYLAAMFHDIAKGRGGDHSELGTLDARLFCKQHGLSKSDTGLVAWLVKAHLVMSSTAQKSDLSDTQVIENFAAQVKNEYRLTALYLLTVADIRGTSPKVWNAWKAKLLENLFLTTRRLLHNADIDTEGEISLRKTQAETILSHYGIANKTYQRFWEKLGKFYFMRHQSQEIAWHSRLLLTHVDTLQPVVRARLSPEGDGIQVMIYTQDKEDLFAKICGFFDKAGYNIVEAKIHTTQHEYALDTFIVLDQNDTSVRYRDLLSYFEYELTQRLLSVQAADKPLLGRLSRQVKHMPIKASVNITADPSSEKHVLEIIAGDRPGLLATLAQTFLELGIYLQTAKINTLGKRAEDIFLISSRNGQALSHEKLTELKNTLTEKLNNQSVTH